MKKCRSRLILTLFMLIVLLTALWQTVFKNMILMCVYPVRFSAAVEKYSDENRIDKYLVFAVIKNESGFDSAAMSSIGAMGLMQITPETFEWAQTKTNETENYTKDDLYKPDVNIQYGTLVLSLLITEFGSEQTALAAYHAGRSNVKKWLADKKYSKDGKTLDYIPFDNTRSYVKKVIDAEAVYNRLYG